MKLRSEHKTSKTVWWPARLSVIALILAAPAAFLCAPAAKAQGSASVQAEAQYQKAEQMRQALEAQPQNSRSLEDYKTLVTAYRRVYLLSASAGAVTPALMEVAQLYGDMGDQFDQTYYQNSLVTYEFLIAQYPGSKFRTDALFELGKIEKDDLAEGPEAKDAFTQFVQKYPHSPRAAEAREALKEIAEGKVSARKPATQAAAKTDASDADDSSANANDSANDARQSADSPPTKSAETAAQPSPDGSQSGPARVTAIRTWNADDYTRVVVDLDGAVKYESARIKDPDRIYFDLYAAHLGKSLTEKEMPVQNGFLKAVRVAQNKDGVVRLVLDVQSVEGYSAFLLPDPFRLVIDVHGALSSASNKKPGTDEGIGKLAGDSPATTPATTVVPPMASEKVIVPATTAAGDSTADASAELSPPPGRNSRTLPVPAIPAIAAQPTRDGERSLTRTLGLKISRIVIDPGHGGHDTGTIGPHGVMEKNVCLDVALRLGKLIQKKLPGAEVIYTRKTDVFVPLEERTAIANQAKADLFISIHANSSHNDTARGIETYYLNFTTSQEALETASRENALSDSSIHELQDLIKKIADNDKIEESRELASDIQNSLTGQLRQVSTAERNRGVKKAPFVVLIGADMPSVLAEISFLSNPTDEKMLQRPMQRQRIAQGIFRGVESYLSSLNSLALDRQKQKLMTVQQPVTSGSSREQR
ncbi:MAG: N-acetylmuramoyl-L-alanine amidase [Candidatus Acidiferrales bacterium]